MPLPPITLRIIGMISNSNNVAPIKNNVPALLNQALQALARVVPFIVLQELTCWNELSKIIAMYPINTITAMLMSMFGLTMLNFQLTTCYLKN